MDKFKHIDTWVFDLDNTLYDAETGVFDRIGRNMTDFVAEFLKLPHGEAEKVRQHYWEKYGTTLYGLMKDHKVDPHHFLEKTHDGVDISDVPPCVVTVEYLTHLPGRKIIFTNTSRAFATRMIKQLGIGHHFDGLFTIEDAKFVPKPKIDPYHDVLRTFNIDPKRAVMFEDTHINLKPAADLGMTTVWIHGKNNNPDVHAQPHLHHKAETLRHWLQHTIKKK